MVMSLIIRMLRINIMVIVSLIGFPLVEPPCEDTIGNCVQYGTDMCSSTSQYEWVDSHCRKFCGFCGEEFYVSACSNFRLSLFVFLFMAIFHV